MSYLLTIIVFILIFSVLILIHELGHFLMAKRSGIKIEEFGIGLPPRIWGKKKGETIYSINWIPIGGFVRMLGEDATDPNMLKKKRSFIAQPMRNRVKVVIAGVMMNFFLAWLLIAIGFTFGMEPLLAPNDVLNAVSDGVVKIDEGLKVKEITPGSFLDEGGVKEGDILVSINDQEISYELLIDAFRDLEAKYQFVRDGEIYSYELVLEENEKTALILGEEHYSVADGETRLGVKFYDFVSFPRIKIFNLDTGSRAYKSGLRAGDVIVSVNEAQVFSVSQYEELIRGASLLDYEVYRDGVSENYLVDLGDIRRVIISKVFSDTPAMGAGLIEGDIIVSINGKKVFDAQEMIEFVASHSDEILVYLIERDGEQIRYEIKPEEGMIGVLLSELMTYGNENGMSVYNADVLSSVLEIEDEKYPFYVAIYKSFGEMLRLSKLTAEMFTGMIVNLIESGEVPDSVAGPVGIAQLTHVFVQQGVMAVLRFVAILSLSLGVINILPFPALDGGRLLFIIVEFVTGRRVNQRWESLIHAMGYVLILLLVLAVTYSDIMRIVQGG